MHFDCHHGIDVVVYGAAAFVCMLLDSVGCYSVRALDGSLKKRKNGWVTDLMSFQHFDISTMLFFPFNEMNTFLKFDYVRCTCNYTTHPYI